MHVCVCVCVCAVCQLDVRNEVLELNDQCSRTTYCGICVTHLVHMQ